MKRRFVVIISFLLLLVACDLKINATINISDILSDTKKVASSELLVNISSCREDSVKEVITAMQNKNFKAKYKTCQDMDMDSYAIFTMPLIIAKNEQDIPNNEALYLLARADELSIHTSDRIKSLLSGDYEKLKIKAVMFNLVNDTEDNIQIHVQSSFVNGQPVLSKNFNIESFDTISIRLSDVASNLLETPNVVYPILKFVK